MSLQSADEQRRQPAVLYAATVGRSCQLPKGGDRKRRAKWRVFGLYVTFLILHCGTLMSQDVFRSER